MSAMSDFQRRRIQNREAQRRFRQRHNQRKNASQALQNQAASEPPNNSTSSITTNTTAATRDPQQTASQSRREPTLAEKRNSPARTISDKLIDPILISSNPSNSNSLFPSTFDGDAGIIYSPTFLDGIDFLNLNNVHGDAIYVDDQAGLPFPTSPSSVLQVPPGELEGSSSDSSADYSLGGLMANTSTGTHSNSNSSSSSKTCCESRYQGNTSPNVGHSEKSNHSSSLPATAPQIEPDTSGPNGGDHETGSWQNALHIAASKGHDRIARILLQHNLIDCNERDSDGFTPLIQGTIGGYEEVVRLLLAHGAAIELVDGQHRRSALHWAIVHRRESVLKILLGWCVKQQTTHAIDVYDDEGRTPLHTAADMGYDAGVQLLLELGANARYRTRKRDRAS